MTAEGGNQPDIRGQMMDKRNVDYYAAFPWNETETRVTTRTSLEDVVLRGVNSSKASTRPGMSRRAACSTEGR